MSRWDKIKNGEIYSFKGGIYPPENKNTTDCPIEQLPSPSRLVLPLKQHSGTAADVLVEVGQHVRMNEPLTAPKSTMQVPIHSPVAGTVEAVTMHNVPHPSGYAEPCIVIKCDDGFDYAGIQEDQIHHYDPIPDYRGKTVDELLERIKSMGIAGLGGAGFPTDVKLRSSASANNCQLLIINGAECEPYITCDDRLMQERADRIMEGISILQYILKPKYTVIAIENNKPKAIAAIEKSLGESGLKDTRVTGIPVKYPSGAARNLITIITGIEISHSARSTSYGIVVHNVSTVYAVADAVLRGQPLIKRIVTVTGSALKKQGNIEVPLGYSIQDIIGYFGYRKPSTARIIIGGPMMGFTIPQADVPVIKTTGCIIAPGEHEIERTKPQVNCIRCGRCARACPSRLIPYELYAYSVAGEHEAVLKCGIKSCIECGCCSYVCPSAIRLIAEFRQEKAQLRLEKMKKDKFKMAKERFEAKQQKLLEEEKLRAERKAAALAKAKLKAAAPAKPAAPVSAAPAVNQTAKETVQSETAVKQPLIQPESAKVAITPAKKEDSGAVLSKPRSSLSPEELERKKQLALEKARQLKEERMRKKAAEAAGTDAVKENN